MFKFTQLGKEGGRLAPVDSKAPTLLTTHGATCHQVRMHPGEPSPIRMSRNAPLYEWDHVTRKWGEGVSSDTPRMGLQRAKALEVILGGWGSGVLGVGTGLR